MSDDHGLYQWHYGIALFCEMKGRFVLFVSSRVFNNNGCQNPGFGCHHERLSQKIIKVKSNPVKQRKSWYAQLKQRRRIGNIKFVCYSIVHCKCKMPLIREDQHDNKGGSKTILREEGDRGVSDHIL